MDPKTVTLCDGVYCWDCEVNDAYKAYEFKRTFGSGVLSLTLTVPVVYLHIFFLKWPISAPVLLFSYALALLIILVTAICILYSKHSRSMHISMTEEEIRITVGTAVSRFFFRNLRRVEPDPGNHRIILVTRFLQPVISVPAEDFESVRDFILRCMESSCN